MTKIDMRGISNQLVLKQVIVTNSEMEGKSIKEINALVRYEVAITRVTRAEVEIVATEEVDLHLADVLMVVGEEEDITKFAQEIGNSPKQLDHPSLIPIFVGLVLGVILGSWPIPIPGMPSPLKLGLAGGPLIAALFLSRLGRVGNLVWYMPMSANFILREIGITLFLACVGLSSGEKFFEILMQGKGFTWMAWASLITLIPILTVGLFLRIKYKMNYFTLCGLLAGSMTDPPALAFANSLAPSNNTSLGYATVYPLVMLLRILCAQILVMVMM